MDLIWFYMVLGKNAKICFAILGRFLIIFDTFDLGIWIFIFRKIKFVSTRNAGSPLLGFKLQFLIFIFRIARPKFRTFDRNLENSTRNSNIRPECLTFDQNFERSTGNSNVCALLGCYMILSGFIWLLVIIATLVIVYMPTFVVMFSALIQNHEGICWELASS